MVGFVVPSVRLVSMEPQNRDSTSLVPFSKNYCKVLRYE
jgi:hypothetical protein